MPDQCPLHFSRDVFSAQELAKLHYRVYIFSEIENEIKVLETFHFFRSTFGPVASVANPFTENLIWICTWLTSILMLY